jgi:HTH-type transcriptional regulator, competence development regulator
MRRFGATLKRLREQRGLSQAALARQARVTQAAISQWESGIRAVPNLALALRVAKALGVELRELVQ